MTPALILEGAPSDEWRTVHTALCDVALSFSGSVCNAWHMVWSKDFTQYLGAHAVSEAWVRYARINLCHAATS